MKKYRVSLLDFSKGTGRIIFQKYADGLKAARAVYPEIKVNYNYSVRCFTGWKGEKNLIICEV